MTLLLMNNKCSRDTFTAPTLGTYEDALDPRHLELEEDRLMASKTSDDAYMAGSISQSGKWRKQKYLSWNQQEGKGDAQGTKKQKFNQPGK